MVKCIFAIGGHLIKKATLSANKLLREYFPKNTLIDSIDKWQTDRTANQINFRSMKCLNYQSLMKLATS